MRRSNSSLLALACMASAQAPSTLEQAVGAALRNAPETELQAATFDRTRAGWVSAMGSALPRLELYGSHTERFQGSPWASATSTQRSDQAGLSASAPLFRPEAWLGAKAASRSVDAARSRREAQKLELVHRTAVAWIDFVGIQRRLAIAQARTLASTRNMEGVRLRTAAGDLTQIDLRQAQSSVFSARAAEANLRADSLRAAEAVLLLCGSAPDPTAAFPDSLLHLDSDTGRPPESPGLCAARLAKESAAMEVAAAKWDALPTVDLLWTSTRAMEAMSSRSPWDHRGELRLSLALPPTPGRLLAARASERIADIQHRQALQRDSSRLRLARQAYEQYRISVSLHLSDSAAAAEVASGRETAFFAGSTTIWEYLSAQKDLHLACDDLWSARIGLAIAGLDLLLEEGGLARHLRIQGAP